MIRIDGVERSVADRRGSHRVRHRLRPQELNLFDNLDVAANVFFGREPFRAGRCISSTARGQCAGVDALLERLGVDFAADDTPSPPSRSPSVSSRDRKGSIARMRGSSSWTSRRRASRLRDRSAAQGHRRSEGRRRRRHLHLASSERGGALRRPCRRAARRQRGGRARAASDQADAMVRLMIGRDLKSLYTPPQAAAGARRSRSRACARRRISRARREPRRSPR